jgi:hypothetical protein
VLNWVEFRQRDHAKSRFGGLAVVPLTVRAPAIPRTSPT